ncbi:MAG: hypothetical protein ACRCXT_18210 [Paraclostridium sp.]
MIVDCLDWHYNGEYPKGIDKENACIHMGMYFTWIINSNLESEELTNTYKEDIIKIKNRKMTGKEFLIDNCNGILNDKFIYKEAREFTFWYYLSSREDYCQYLADYLDVFLDENINSLYKLDDSWDNYEKISRVITSRYKKWKESK